MADRTDAMTRNAASGRNWFRPEYLPGEIHTQSFLYSGPSRVQYHNGVRLFSIQSGEGALVVNGREYPVESGSCGLLYYCDFHRFVPKAGQVLNGTLCSFPYETFLFASVYPSNELISIQTAGESIVILPKSESDRTRLLQLFDMLKSSEKAYGTRMKCALLFEILARLNILWNNERQR